MLRELVENDRIIGGVSGRCSERARALYRVFVQAECLVTNARTAEMVSFYGADAMLLIGGALLEARDGLAEASRAFLTAVEEAAASLPEPEPEAENMAQA